MQFRKIMVTTAFFFKYVDVYAEFSIILRKSNIPPPPLSHEIFTFLFLNKICVCLVTFFIPSSTFPLWKFSVSFEFFSRYLLHNFTYVYTIKNKVSRLFWINFSISSPWHFFKKQILLIFRSYFSLFFSRKFSIFPWIKFVFISPRFCLKNATSKLKSNLGFELTGAENHTTDIHDDFLSLGPASRWLHPRHVSLQSSNTTIK